MMRSKLHGHMKMEWGEIGQALAKDSRECKLDIGRKL